MKTIVFMDFDGTLTSKDSMFDFLSFSFGKAELIKGVISVLPQLALHKLGVKSAKEAKEKLLTHFIYKKTESEIKRLGDNYGMSRIQDIIRDEAMEKIKWHKNMKHQIYIVSASIDIWLGYWCKQHGLLLISTQIEYDNGVFIGNILGENCNGQEKVDRINKVVNLDAFDCIYSYGDTSGDFPMLSIADKPFFRPFKK